VPGICEPSHCADLSISTSWPSLSWANATVTTAGRCACSQCGGSIPHSRAGPDGEGMGFGYLQRSSLIPTAGSESCCGPLSSADRTVSLRAEMVPPNPGLRSRTRRMVRPVLGSADHATSGAGSAFGTFASAAAPKRSSIPGRPSLGHPSIGMAHVTYVQRTFISTTDVAMRYSHRRTRYFSSVAGAAHDAGLDQGAALWPTAFGRA
jgi:hypothetical protein